MPFTGSDAEAEIHTVRRMPKARVFEAQLENQGAREREVTQRSERKAGPRLGREILAPGRQRSVVIRRASLKSASGFCIDGGWWQCDERWGEETQVSIRRLFLGPHEKLKIGVGLVAMFQHIAPSIYKRSFVRGHRPPPGMVNLSHWKAHQILPSILIKASVKSGN